MGGTGHVGTALLSSRTTITAATSGTIVGNLALRAVTLVVPFGHIAHDAAVHFSALATFNATGNVAYNGLCQMSDIAKVVATAAAIRTSGAFIGVQTTLTANASPVRNAISAMQAITGLTVTGAVYHAAGANLVAKSTVLAAAGVAQPAGAGMVASTIVSAMPLVVRNAASFLRDRTTILAATSGTIVAHATFPAQTTLVAQVQSVLGASALLEGVASVTTVATVTHEALCNLTAATAVAATGVTAHNAVAFITTDTTLVGAAYVGPRGILTCSGTVGATATVLHEAVAAITSTATVLAVQLSIYNAEADLAAVTTSLATGWTAHYADVGITTVTTLALNGVVKYDASALLAGEAALGAVADMNLSATALLAASTSLTANNIAINAGMSRIQAVTTTDAKAGVILDGIAVLTYDWYCGADAVVIAAGNVNVTANTTVGAYANANWQAAAAISCQSSLILKPWYILNTIGTSVGRAVVNGVGLLTALPRRTILYPPGTLVYAQGQACRVELVVSVHVTAQQNVYLMASGRIYREDMLSVVYQYPYQEAKKHQAALEGGASQYGESNITATSNGKTIRNYDAYGCLEYTVAPPIAVVPSHPTHFVSLTQIPTPPPPPPESPPKPPVGPYPPPIVLIPTPFVSKHGGGPSGHSRRVSRGMPTAQPAAPAGPVATKARTRPVDTVNTRQAKANRQRSSRRR